MPKKVIMPSAEEDAAITAAAKADPDNPPLDDMFGQTARRGRPALADKDKKQRVNVMLDPDVYAALQAFKDEGGKISPRVNDLLRRDLGL